MTEPHTLLAHALDGFERRRAAVPDDAWDRPTPCDGWTVRDLVDHVVEEGRWAASELSDAGDTASLRSALDDPGVLDRTVALPSGPAPARDVLFELFADHLVHTWDLAHAIGADEHLDPTLVEACARWFDDHEASWREAGEVGAPVRVPDDADAQTALLARFGREVDRTTPPWGELSQQLHGTVVRPQDRTYDETRALWNGLVERRPAAIARCADVEDVQAAVRFSTDHGVLVAVRGGGHNVAGTAGVDGGLVIDLSAMNQVEVDPRGGLARAGGGATWADLDAATQEHGLAAPGGLVSKTGLGGLTLGGGLGWLRRRHGLACDDLVGATLVTADGEVRQVDEASDPDLLWGLRGGGGNLGVVTELTHRLHPVGPEVFTALVVHHGDRAGEVLRAWRDWTVGLDDDVSSMAICGAVPEDEDFPAAAWGEPMVFLAACAAGDPDRGEAVTRPLRELADPIVDLSGPMPFVDLQQLFDEDYPDGARYYWKSVHLPALDDDTIALVDAWARACPSALSTVDVWHLGGAMARVAPGATAFGDRSCPFLLGVEANWEDPADDDDNIGWARDCVEAFRHVSTGRQYLNFPGFLENHEATLRSAHGDANYQRLAELKRRVDPDNHFRLHQNVPPA